MGSDLGSDKFTLWTRQKTGYKEVKVSGVTCATAVRTATEGETDFLHI